jgi:ubiquinone biosynthesis monooxygenase Coq7
MACTINPPIKQMIRVNQAGECGAVRIYQGQLAILSRSASAETLQYMLTQEQQHLEAFNKMIVERRVRPTLLSPIWSIFGYALGATTALLGEKSAMACTVAIEDVIDDHYAQQERSLNDEESELKNLIIQCRQDENEHRQTGLNLGAEQAVGYRLLSGAIKFGARMAIRLSKKI